MAASEKKNVLILGGGLSGLAAAAALSQFEEQIQVTVVEKMPYPGGKAASTRTRKKDAPAEPDRIIEHGLHVLMGFYENTFCLLRQVYTAEPYGYSREDWPTALSHMFEADYSMTISEPGQDGRPSRWRRFELMKRESRPGELCSAAGSIVGDGATLTGAGLLVEEPSAQEPALETRIQIYEMLEHILIATHTVACQGAIGFLSSEPPGDAFGVLTSALSEGQDLDLKSVPEGIEPSAAVAISTLSYAARYWRRQACTDDCKDKDEFRDVLKDLLFYLRLFRDIFYLTLRPDGDIERSDVWHIIDVLSTTAIGLIADEVYLPEPGQGELGESEWIENLAGLDERSYRGWLRHHGAHEPTLNCGVIRAIESGLFALEHAKAKGGRRGVGAGTFIYGAWRMLFGYSGSPFYKMKGGMGEIVIAPIFNYLQCETSTRFWLDADIKSISIKTEAGVSTVDEVKVAHAANNERPVGRGLPGTHRVPLEHFPEICTGFYGRQFWYATDQLEALPNETSLAAGEDFDVVILTLPPAVSRPMLTSQSLPESLRNAVNGIEDTAVLSAQLWYERCVDEDGKPCEREEDQKHAVVSGDVAPLDVLADMSHLKDAEPGYGSVVYLCGGFADGPSVEPLSVSPGQMLNQWVQSGGAEKLSRLVETSTSGQLPKLVGSVAYKRDQPHERYVLSTPGTRVHRIRADESGVSNMMVAGDWTRTALSVGSAEAAVVSGLLAAKAALKQVGLEELAKKIKVYKEPGEG